MKKVFAVLLACTLLGAGVFAFLSKRGGSKIQILETVKAEKATIEDQLLATGIVKPVVGAKIEIGARATGLISSLPVKVGDRVEGGQLIAKIDSREIERNIETMRVSLRIMKANLEKEKSLFPVNTDLQHKNIEKREADLRLAERNYGRQKMLHDQNASTDEKLDQSLHELKLAQAELDSAKTELIRIRTSHTNDVQVLENQIMETESRLQELLVQRSYYDIHAPISGVVTQVAADEGETIVAGLQVANLITILQPERLEMWIYVDETDIGKIKEGMKVVYTVDTYPKRKFEGKISRIYLEPETKEGIVYYTAVITMTSEDALLLKTDMTTHVRIIREVKENVLSVKNGAVKWDGAESVVYKITGDKKNPAERISVKTGVKDENNTEITEGLSEGDEVALKIILPEKRQGFN
jgi:multidrug efflux pump subunit AcrA (membrane-fusion protein)